MQANMNFLPAFGRIEYRQSAANKTSKQVKPLIESQTAHRNNQSVAHLGGSFRFKDPNMRTQIIDPFGLKKVFKIPEFFRFRIR
jgi:hypothetical protein